MDPDCPGFSNCYPIGLRKTRGYHEARRWVRRSGMSVASKSCTVECRGAFYRSIGVAHVEAERFSAKMHVYHEVGDHDWLRKSGIQSHLVVRIAGRYANRVWYDALLSQLHLVSNISVC